MCIASDSRNHCNTVYPHTITRPVDKYKLNPKPYFTNFIQDVLQAGCIICQYIGDNPKRALAREALHHASSYACEYCFAKATSYLVTSKQLDIKKKEIELQISVIDKRIENVMIQEDIDNEELDTLNSIKSSLETSLAEANKSKKVVVWPSSSMNGEPRTTEKVLEIVNLIEERGQLPQDEAKGIVGRSPLLDIPNFDMVRDNPTEYLHSVCLGVGKRMVELTFNVGVNRPRVTKRKLSSPASFNEQIKNIKVVFEFPRRARSLDFSVWKGLEYRNLIIFHFPLVLNCIERNAKERKLWLLMAHAIRACVLPTEEFHHFELDLITTCCSEFYILYEKLFGPRNCSYNTHIVWSHLVEMRVHGPLTNTSAFGFENFYGEVRQSFCAGTVSPLKQIFEKVLLKRAIGHHVCSPSLMLTVHETSLECNNLIYTFVNRRYNMYKIKEIINSEEDPSLMCAKIQTRQKKFVETPNLNWSKVGVFELESVTNEIVKIPQNTVAGKLIKINKILLTCSYNVLVEK